MIFAPMNFTPFENTNLATVFKIFENFVNEISFSKNRLNKIYPRRYLSAVGDCLPIARAAF